jgi:DNA-binding MarR family transcriptional regulator
MHALWHSIGLHRGQPFMLRILWAEEGLTQTELARRLHRTPATITNMLQRLQKAGFVERRPDPHDQRVSRVSLTEAGREIQAQVEQVWQENEERTLEGFSGPETTALRDYLERIRENLLREHRETASITQEVSEESA